MKAQVGIKTFSERNDIKFKKGFYTIPETMNLYHFFNI